MMVGLVGMGRDLARAARIERAADDGGLGRQPDEGALAMVAALGGLLRELEALERCHAGALEAQGSRIAALIGLLQRHADTQRRGEAEGGEARTIGAALRALAARLGIPVSDVERGGIMLDVADREGEEARRIETLMAHLRGEIAALRWRIAAFRG